MNLCERLDGTSVWGTSLANPGPAILCLMGRTGNATSNFVTTDRQYHMKWQACQSEDPMTKTTKKNNPYWRSCKELMISLNCYDTRYLPFSFLKITNWNGALHIVPNTISWPNPTSICTMAATHVHQLDRIVVVASGFIIRDPVTIVTKILPKATIFNHIGVTVIKAWIAVLIWYIHPLQTEICIQSNKQRIDPSRYHGNKYNRSG